MLNQVDLGTKMKKEELKEVLDEKLGYELGKVQRHARAAGMPVILVIEGWRHSRDVYKRQGRHILVLKKWPGEMRKIKRGPI